MLRQIFSDLQSEIEKYKKIYEDEFIKIKPHYDNYQISLHHLEYQKRDIVNSLIEIQNALIKKESCRCGNCRLRFYDEGWLSENGVCLRMDADHPNDIRDTYFTWEEIDVLLLNKYEILKDEDDE